MRQMLIKNWIHRVASVSWLCPILCMCISLHACTPLFICVTAPWWKEMEMATWAGALYSTNALIETKEVNSLYRDL